MDKHAGCAYKDGLGEKVTAISKYGLRNTKAVRYAEVTVITGDLCKLDSSFSLFFTNVSTTTITILRTKTGTDNVYSTQRE